MDPGREQSIGMEAFLKIRAIANDKKQMPLTCPILP